MDNQRLLVWATFGLLLYLNYQAWIQDYRLPPESQGIATVEETSQEVDELGPPELPPERQSSRETDISSPTLDEFSPVREVRGAKTIYVTTDVLDLEINTKGGTLERAQLLGYPVAKDQPNELVELLSSAPSELGLIQTGLNSAGSTPKANHTAEYDAEITRFELGGFDRVVVPMTWTDGLGIIVEKTLTFTRGSYRIDIDHRVINRSDSDWRGAEYAQIIRRLRQQERSMFDVDSYSFDGPLVYDGQKSEKFDEDDLASDSPNFRAINGWLASIEHHFLSAIVPPEDIEYVYDLSLRRDSTLASFIRTPSIVVRPGEDYLFETTVFVGPKLQLQLEEITEKLKLTVDYGWLTILSQPLFWLLSLAYSILKNWGAAIIAVTILIKLVFYKLTEASGRSMAKMREIQPRMKALQDRYKDDRQALSQAMMELYKREKVNPAAGCLPILIQMPFFLAFYWVLLESVEMRQAPFALWITDLSSRDPFFILPIIMGAAMLFQQKLNPTPGDPIQARVMQIMPIMFTGFFAFFPSGLVLYWVTNTVLSIAQQWYINKVVHEEALAKKGRKQKKGKDAS